MCGWLTLPETQNIQINYVPKIHLGIGWCNTSYLHLRSIVDAVDPETFHWTNTLSDLQWCNKQLASSLVRKFALQFILMFLKQYNTFNAVKNILANVKNQLPYCRGGGVFRHLFCSGWFYMPYAVRKQKIFWKKIKFYVLPPVLPPVWKIVNPHYSPKN